MARGTWPWRLLAVSWVVLIFLLSSQSDLPGPDTLPEWLPVDKIGHFGMFAVLAALLYLSGLQAALAVLATGVYGALDEVHQLFVPGRTAHAADWLADVLGGATGVWIAALFESRAAGRRKSR